MNFTKIIPGLIVSIIIALASQLVTKVSFFSNFGAALIAILLGMLLGNTFCKSEKLKDGTKFSEKRLLEYAIILNGLILDATIMKKVGISGLFYVILQLFITLFIAYYISRKFGFSKKFSLLMGAGNAVCGSSAIGTVAPVIQADSKEKGISITCVNILGTLLMITLPILAGILYNSETIHSSALIGGVVQSVGQVIASAKLVNDNVVEMATVLKLIRVLMIVFIAILFKNLNVEEDKKLFQKNEVKNDKKAEVGIPYFIILFFLCFVLRSTGYLPKEILLLTKKISTQFELIALAAIGLQVKFIDIAKEGIKALTTTLLIGIFQVLLAISFIRLFFK